MQNFFNESSWSALSCSNDNDKPRNSLIMVRINIRTSFIQNERRFFKYHIQQIIILYYDHIIVFIWNLTFLLFKICREVWGLLFSAASINKMYNNFKKQFLSRITKKCNDCVVYFEILIKQIIAKIYRN